MVIFVFKFRGPWTFAIKQRENPKVITTRNAQLPVVSWGSQGETKNDPVRPRARTQKKYIVRARDGRKAFSLDFLAKPATPRKHWYSCICGCDHLVTPTLL